MNNFETSKKVLLGMSGGVDSSVAALLLMKGGYQTVGVTLKLHNFKDNLQTGEKLCGSSSDIEDAKKVCEKLGIEHYVFNFTDKFENAVIEKFVHEYRVGHTPNPCIDCNRYIKFYEMSKKAEELSIDYIATGHYARVQKSGDRFLLTKPVDKSKDQTYVLYVLNQQMLSKIIMPLGELTKTEVRKIAAENGFVNANKPDSQDICFVPDGKYADFIAKKENAPLSLGNFVDISGNIMGKHQGAERYTIGQRKGLGMGFGKPMYVVGKNSENFSVILGDEKDLYTNTVRIEDTVFSAFDRLNAPIRCKGKLRYRQNEEDCIIYPIDEKTVIAEFDKPQRAVTPGQAAVFYDGDTVLGGGTIVY